MSHPYLLWPANLDSLWTSDAQVQHLPGTLQWKPEEYISLWQAREAQRGLMFFLSLLGFC